MERLDRHDIEGNAVNADYLLYTVVYYFKSEHRTRTYNDVSEDAYMNHIKFAEKAGMACRYEDDVKTVFGVTIRRRTLEATIE